MLMEQLHAQQKEYTHQPQIMMTDAERRVEGFCLYIPWAAWYGESVKLL